MLVYVAYAFSTLVLVYFLLKLYLKPRMVKSTKQLDGKIVIVTGSNVGIGYEAALDFAKRNAHVIVACRNKQLGEKAVEQIKSESGNQTVEFEQLDLASLKSVRSFAERVNKKYDRIDVLVNNAGVFLHQYGAKTEEGFEMTFGVNHLGHFLLTTLLIDKIKASPASRIVTVSAPAHVGVDMEWNDLNLEKRKDAVHAYGQSKLANILMTIELAKRYGDQGVTAVSLNPGAVKTNIFRNITTEFNRYSILYLIGGPFFMLFAKDAKQGAQTIIHCVVDDDVPKHNGKYYQDCALYCTYKTANEENAKRLWEVSENLVGLK